VRPGLPIRLLSGGNLQKALIAREVVQDHKMLIARSPTRGLDVGATSTVRDQILAERDRGIAVLLISEDLDELLALSDRLMVMYRARSSARCRPPKQRRSGWACSCRGRARNRSHEPPHHR
jgi:ABC-type uncharacterized transport system ATPase subunit